MEYKITICYHARVKKYLKKLNRNEKNKVIVLIKKRVMEFLVKKDKRYIFQDHFFEKLGRFDSTVYYLKLNVKDRVILSIDEDPIFEQIIVNIFSICSEDKLKLEIQGIMESLYQKMINGTPCDEEEE